MKKPKSLPKEKLSKRTGICETYADKIHKTNATYAQILGVAYHIWDTAYGEGYEDANCDHKKLRDCRERLLKQDFNELRDSIEDKIHQTQS